MKLSDGSVEQSRSTALATLVEALQLRDYRFVPPTPATHARILARDPERRGASLVDMLGWSRPFEPGTIDPEIETLLARAGELEPCGTAQRSRLRAARLEGDLFLHSAYPTDSADSVFLGPDSYRFARLIRQVVECRACAPGATIVDIGTGAGVGGIVAARLVPGGRVVLTDINPLALQLAEANARAAGVRVALREGPILAGFSEPIDLAVANPPYIVDADRRAYRDGGDRHGAALSIEMAACVLPALAEGGRFILYTGSAIVGNEDGLQRSLVALAALHGCVLDYSEIDPDVFGEELERPAYREVDRIAVVSAIFTRAGAVLP